MTLNIAVVSEQGAWFCSDRRMGNATTAEASNAARKGFGLKWKYGVAWFTVAGFIHGDIGLEWYGSAIKSLSPINSLANLLEGLHRCMSEAFVQPSIELQKPVTLAIGGYTNDGPFLVHINNARKCENRFSTFEVHRVPLREGKPLCMMSGHWKATRPEDADEIDAAFAPGHPVEITEGVRMLAAINRRAAFRPHSKGTISAGCAVTYLYPKPPARIDKWQVGALGELSRRTD